jgi:hypothetical protein
VPDFLRQLHFLRLSARRARSRLIRRGGAGVSATRSTPQLCSTNIAENPSLRQLLRRFVLNARPTAAIGAAMPQRICSISLSKYGCHAASIARAMTGTSYASHRRDAPKVQFRGVTRMGELRLFDRAPGFSHGEQEIDKTLQHNSLYQFYPLALRFDS